MKMRTRNPEERKLEIRWSTQRWVPAIVVAPARDEARGCISVDGEPGRRELFGNMSLKRRQTTTTWSRDGSRSTWR